jgi:hypothetical protein
MIHTWTITFSPKYDTYLGNNILRLRYCYLIGFGLSIIYAASHHTDFSTPPPHFSPLMTSLFKNRSSLKGSWIILPGSKPLTHCNIIFKFPACSFTCAPPCTSLNLFTFTGTNSPWKVWACGVVGCYNIDPGRGSNSRLFKWYWGEPFPRVMWPGCAHEISLHLWCWG